jgi:hypothetical protein
LDNTVEYRRSVEASSMMDLGAARKQGLARAGVFGEFLMVIISSQPGRS